MEHPSSAAIFSRSYIKQTYKQSILSEQGVNPPPLSLSLSFALKLAGQWWLSAFHTTGQVQSNLNPVWGEKGEINWCQETKASPQFPCDMGYLGIKILVGLHLLEKCFLISDTGNSYRHMNTPLLYSQFILALLWNRSLTKYKTRNYINAVDYLF